MTGASVHIIAQGINGDRSLPRYVTPLCRLICVFVITGAILTYQDTLGEIAFSLFYMGVFFLMALTDFMAGVRNECRRC